MHEVIPGARVEGRLALDGRDLYGPGVDPVGVRRQVGMVFQRPNPFPTMSIYDNVVAGMRLNNKKAKKSVLDELVEMSLRGANLWKEVKDRLDKPGSGLSGGQQQRLCIARAIAVQPDVLLMDEPCSALDPISTLAIEDLINELKTEYTIVIVTHNMQQAARVSDYTGFFNIEGTGKPGRLVEMDETRTIFSHPTREGDRRLRVGPLRLTPGGPGPSRRSWRVAWLVVHLAAVAVLAGVGWVVQLVVYPAFRLVGRTSGALPRRTRGRSPGSSRAVARPGGVDGRAR